MKHLLILFFLSRIGAFGQSQTCLQVDSSFGIDGRSIGSINGYINEDVTTSLLVQSDNKIIQLVRAGNQEHTGVGLIRYHPNGQVDLSLGPMAVYF